VSFNSALTAVSLAFDIRRRAGLDLKEA
jgi:hypothetical protein